MRSPVKHILSYTLHSFANTNFIDVGTKPVVCCSSGGHMKPKRVCALIAFALTFALPSLASTVSYDTLAGQDFGFLIVGFPNGHGTFTSDAKETSDDAENELPFEVTFSNAIVGSIIMSYFNDAPANFAAPVIQQVLAAEEVNRPTEVTASVLTPAVSPAVVSPRVDPGPPAPFLMADLFPGSI